MKSSNKQDTNKNNELLEKVNHINALKKVKSSFYNTNSYTAKHFYKIISNC